jgi:hypothetical protein
MATVFGDVPGGKVDMTTAGAECLLDPKRPSTFAMSTSDPEQTFAA